MSFKVFIYYCALCGGWAAFLAWAVVLIFKLPDKDALTFSAGTGAVMGGEDVKAASKKLLNGVYGGLLGGFVGGLPFTLIYSSTKLSDLVPHARLTIGLVLLGICIGLMIGLAQVILKQAWLRVEEGFRPGRELLLTKDETTIGRAESCDLGLFGDNTVQKLHARILLQNNRYLLVHAAEDG